MVKEDDGYTTRVESVRKKLKETEGDRRWWKPKEGKHIFRVLPPWGPAADGQFFYTAGLHYHFQIGGQNRALPCRKTLIPKQRCIVCEFIEALKGSGNDELQELGGNSQKSIRMKRKYWVNLVDRAYPKEVKMWGTGRKLITTVEQAMSDKDFGDITDPEEGHDIRVTRTGSTFTNTRYEFMVRPKPSPLGLENWKKKMHKLDQEVIEWLSTPEMAKILRENYEDEMAEVGFKIKVKGVEDEEEKKPKKKPISEDEVEDEDTEDEQEDEDDDEDETPKKKPKKEDEDSEDEDEEDDEVDEDGEED